MLPFHIRWLKESGEHISALGMDELLSETASLFLARFV